LGNPCPKRFKSMEIKTVSKIDLRRRSKPVLPLLNFCSFAMHNFLPKNCHHCCKRSSCVYVCYRQKMNEKKNKEHCKPIQSAKKEAPPGKSTPPRPSRQERINDFHYSSLDLPASAPAKARSWQPLKHKPSQGLSRP